MVFLRKRNNGGDGFIVAAELKTGRSGAGDPLFWHTQGGCTAREAYEKAYAAEAPRTQAHRPWWP